MSAKKYIFGVCSFKKKTKKGRKYKIKKEMKNVKQSELFTFKKKRMFHALYFASALLHFNISFIEEVTALSG